MPRKVLSPLAGQPVVKHVLNAVMQATLIDEVMLATTVSSSDDDLATIGRAMGVRVFRGSEADVLGRFVAALSEIHADVVVRHTADDPLLDATVIDTVIGSFLKEGCDYASNMIERSWPRGLDTEVMSRDALECSNREGIRPEDREHVTIYMRTNPNRFQLHNVKALPQETWPDLRLCIDTPEDQSLLEKVFDALYVPGRIIRVGTVIDWLREHSEIAALNASVAQRPTLGKVY
ncbi:MAG: glycosyltransferase family protein [Pyrinomonadaceae bacterium]|nr:glycosyltransferase family protein [Pyrinomonadaceae bacterium]